MSDDDLFMDVHRFTRPAGKEYARADAVVARATLIPLGRRRRAQAVARASVDGDGRRARRAPTRRRRSIASFD